MELTAERVPLDDLLAFASRDNPLRPFLFVSKVLGKHWPCRPSAMRHSYDLLASPLLGCPGPLLLVGMAETATALGHGVYDCLRRWRSDGMYIHTTRHALDRPVAMTVDEAHSHAADHTIHEPDPPLRSTFEDARTLVLVDDEVTTGRTLAHLGSAYLRRNPRVEQIVIVALVSWLGEERRAALEQELGPIRMVALAEGTFAFSPRPGHRAGFPPGARHATRRTLHASDRFGRAGTSGAVHVHPPRLPPASRVLVVGTGEFAFPPFRLAEALEQEGHDVLFQSTTRSPIALGDAIGSRLVFGDHHDEGVTNYLYNRPTDDRVTIVGYEHPDLATSHELPALLGATCWSPEA